MKSNLAAFVKKPVSPILDAPLHEGTSAQATPGDRQRGKGSTVAITIRLARHDWERVHQLAVSEGASINGLALRGLSRLFKEKGLPEIAG